MGEHRWSARLRGDPTDLSDMVTVLRSPELSVVERGSACYLEAPGLNHIDQPLEALDAAEKLLGVAVGLARLSTPIRGPVELTGSISDLAADPPTETTVVRTPAVEISVRAPIASIRIDGVAQRSPTDDARAALAISDDHVGLALELMARDLTWARLYQVLDVASEDSGASAVERLVGHDQLRRFKRTANNYRALGPDARHARLSCQPPPKPMTLHEARELMTELVRRWIDAKAAASTDSLR